MYFCDPKRRFVSDHFPYGSKSFLFVQERQQGVTKNKLYNAKGKNQQQRKKAL